MGSLRRRHSRKNVALIVETSNAYARGILHGIRDFIRDAPGWSIYLAEHSRHEAHRSIPDNWDGDGVIARIETAAIARVVRRMSVPTVDVSAGRLIPGTPWVETDDAAIAELAVEHLVGCGLRHLAFFGDPTYAWSRFRCDNFHKVAAGLGFQAHVYNLPSRRELRVQWYRERGRLHEWLASLPKPVGIFACYDACGQQLLEVCRYYGLSVPDEVAVIGVDNDELLCDLSYPPLSSVIPNARQTGYLAASMLDRMMRGEPVAGEKISVKPLGVQKRMSTDIVAVEDPHVSDAVSYIREHARDNIRIRDILRHVPLSRRVFETRFRRALNRTPHEEIVHARIELAKRLLLQSDMRLASIAEELGFAHPEYLSVVFKKATGLTPRQYRNQLGGARPRS